jgi:iron(III) transport system permease protein
MLAGLGALLIASAATLLAYAVRLDGRVLVRGVARIATLGYAIPGTVLAVGIFVPVAALNNLLQPLLDRTLGAGAPALFLQGTLAVLLLAYLARFLAVGYGPMDGAMQRVSRSADEVAVSLGVTGWALLRRVHLPLLRTGLATGATLAFVDIMKEMPITLITRPFGWDTLAVRVFEMTAEGEWQRAALPAVAIVLTGLIPVALLTRSGRHVA